MSVLIKGIEMPSKKAIAVVIHPDGTAYSSEMFAGVCTEYLADCTAVHVPPHGRLIEKHDVFKLISAFPEVDKLLPVEFMEALYNLPTVIPASEEGET